MINDNSIVCALCSGRMLEDMHTGEMTCDTCLMVILPDGTIDCSNCEEIEE